MKNKTDLEKMSALCKQLMWFADRMTKKPFFISHPTTEIIQNNIDLIIKYNLDEMIDYQNNKIDKNDSI